MKHLPSKTVIVGYGISLLSGGLGSFAATQQHSWAALILGVIAGISLIGAAVDWKDAISIEIEKLK